MSWIRKNYIPDNPVKYHITHPDASISVDHNILKEHDCLLSNEEDVDTLIIDPGGSLIMSNEPITNVIDGLSVSVKPEHISGANIIWSSNAFELPQLTDSGEKVFVVSMDTFNCAAMPESTYVKIGAWLASLSAIGYSALVELSVALEGSENCEVNLPKCIEE